MYKKFRRPKFQFLPRPALFFCWETEVFDPKWKQKMLVKNRFEINIIHVLQVTWLVNLILLLILLKRG